MLARQQVLSKPIKIELQPAADLAEVEHDSDQITGALISCSMRASHGRRWHRACRHRSRGDFATVDVSDTDVHSPKNLTISSALSSPPRAMAPAWSSLARRIVEEHHGRIEVSSIEGREQVHRTGAVQTPAAEAYPPNRPALQRMGAGVAPILSPRPSFVFVPEVEAEMRVRFRAVDLHRNLGTGAVLAEKWVDRFQQ